MNESPSPHQVFVDVLTHRHAGAQRRALTGESIAAHAELNHLLGRTKARPAPTVWADCAAELQRCMRLYTGARARFAAAVPDDFPNGVDAAPDPTLGPETTRAFQAAADGLRAALDVLRGGSPACSAVRAGCASGGTCARSTGLDAERSRVGNRHGEEG